MKRQYKYTFVQCIYSTAQRQGITRARFERGERAFHTRLLLDETRATRGGNEA